MNAKTNAIIAIAREHGSGGREIGMKLAESLGIPFYDKELIARTAKESGLAENFLKGVDEAQIPDYLYSVFSSKENVFEKAREAQTDVILVHTDTIIPNPPKK